MKRRALFGTSLALALELTTGCAPVPPREPPASAISVSELLPVRVRRLSNAEYESSVRSLLGTQAAVAERLPPDLRVDGFTQNDQLVAHPAWMSRLSILAKDLAEEFAREHPERLCPDRGDCQYSFIEDVGPRALRRPLTDEETRSLVRLHEQAGGRGDSLRSKRRGAEAVLIALLQSPSQLYLSEKGQPTSRKDVRRLDDFEIASVLSFMLVGAPPDEELLAAAEQRRLGLGEERRQQALRLLAESETRHHFRRFVAEWLEIDQLNLTSKDPNVFRDYEDLKPRMLNETYAFVDEVMVHRGASVAALLDSGFSSVDPTLARYYGYGGWGPRVPSRRQGRLGVLQQASFLAAHAHSTHTSPVRRGDFVLRRLLCVEVPRPGEVGIETMMPEPSQVMTTRQRFSNHAQAGCKSCHELIDPLGYAFESFDAAGRFRETENGKPVETAGSFRGEDLSISFSGSTELTAWLARQPRVQSCFLDHAFRFFSSQGDPDLDGTLSEIAMTLPEDRRTNLLASLVAYAESDAFIFRRVEP